ncbi:MAG: hypothetical protein KC505_10780, partial [Myxococcales bacterium]|nr:hypothetical protein [Myxococcales bacterium]
MFLIVATFIFFSLSTCIHTYSSIADFVNNYTFASNQEKQDPQVFMTMLNDSLKDLTPDNKIAAILEQDANGNNGIMAFIKNGIYADQNGKNLLQLLNCLPNETNHLKKALTSVNNDNQSALSLAFIHYEGAMSTLSALWEKMEKIPNYVLLFQEKDKNEHNFIFKALIENFPRFFDGYGYGFHNLVFKDANLTKDLLLEKCPITLQDNETQQIKEIKINILTYALLTNDEQFLFKIFKIFINNGENYKRVNEIKEILKTIVLYHDENNENLLMYAFMYEASPDLIKLFLSYFSGYDELVTLLFTKENKKNFWAFSLAFKNKNYL